MLHLIVSPSLNDATIDVRLKPLHKFFHCLSRSSVSGGNFKRRQKKVVGGVASESEGEGEVKFEVSSSTTDRRALTLRAPVKTRWNSAFECIH